MVLHHAYAYMICHYTVQWNNVFIANLLQYLGPIWIGNIVLRSSVPPDVPVSEPRHQPNSPTLFTCVCACLLASNHIRSWAHCPFLSIHCNFASALPRRALAQPRWRDALHRTRPTAVLSLHRVGFKCFNCFKNMFKCFRMDLTKVNRDVAYVAIVVHVCYECLLSMFYLFSTYVASVLSWCCVCLQWFLSFFMSLQAFQTHVSNVSTVFRRILRVLHLNFSKVDRVLHMLQCDLPAVATKRGREGSCGT
jgi:hypothetical protein